MNKHYAREDPWLSNKHTQRCSVLSVVWEMQIKHRMRHYYTLTVIAKIKKDNDKC